MTRITSLIIIGLFCFLPILQAQDFDWAFSIDSDGDDEVCQLVYKNETIHAVGYISGGADFDPSGLTYSIDVSKSKDAFMATYSDNKVLLSATRITLGKGEYTNNSKTISFSDGWTKPTDFCLDNNNNYYLSGYFKGTVNFNPNGDQVIRISPEGEGSESPYSDLFIAKYSSDGQLLWVHTAGGESADEASHIEMGSDGSLYVQGTYSGTIDFDPYGDGDIKSGGDTNWGNNTFVSKFSADGSYLWTKTFHSYKTDGVTSGRLFTNDFKIDPQTDDFYIAGHYSYSLYLNDENPQEITLANDRSGKYNGFIAKYNSDGDLLWASDAIKGINESLCYIQGLTIDDESKVYFTGQMSGTVEFTDGTTLTAEDISWSGFVACIEGSTDKALWSTVYSEGSEYAKILPLKISISHDQEIFVTGRFLETMILDIDGGLEITTTAASDGSIRKYDLFLFKLDSKGNLENCQTVGGPGNDGMESPIVLGDNKELYMMGNFVGEANFNIQDDSNPYTITSVGNESAFIVRFNNAMSLSNGKSILSFSQGYIDESDTTIEAPLGTSFVNLAENMTISNNATFSFFNSENEIVENSSTTTISANSFIIVEAENGTSKTYAIKLTDGNDILNTAYGELNQTELQITHIPQDIDVESFLDGIVFSGGATVQVKQGSTVITDLSVSISSDMTIEVTSINNTTKTYSVQILLEGNDIIASQLGSLDDNALLVYISTNVNASDFVSGLTISEGATITIYQNSILLTDYNNVILNEEYSIHVISQAGTEQIYSLQVVANAQNFILTTNIGILITITKSILNVPSNTSVAQLRDAITVSEGASIEFYDTNSGVMVTNESETTVSSVEIHVISLTGDTNTYTLTVITSNAILKDDMDIFYYSNTTNELVLQSSNTNIATITIYDLKGQKMVTTSKALNQEIRITLELITAQYIAVVVSKSGVSTLKFTVK